MPKVTKEVAAFRKKCKAAHTKWARLANEYNPDMLRIGDKGEQLFWDLAIIGIGKQHGSSYVFIYDEQLLTDSYTEYMMLELGTPAESAYELAVEWVSFNVTDAYHGPNTPIIRITDGEDS